MVVDAPGAAGRARDDHLRNQIATALEDFSRINFWVVGAVVLAFVALSYFVRRWLSEVAQ